MTEGDNLLQGFSKSDTVGPPSDKIKPSTNKINRKFIVAMESVS